jgi:ribonucleotide monophosphatase NagD (HAD superfamily)
MTDTDFAEYDVDTEIRAVIKGPHQKFDYRKLAIASLVLQDPNVIFVATNEDPVFQSGKSGRLMPDVGATLHIIEQATGR